jgi:hypothetical protein
MGGIVVAAVLLWVLFRAMQKGGGMGNVAYFIMKVILIGIPVSIVLGIIFFFIDLFS